MLNVKRFSALALFVLGVVTDYHDLAFALDHFALFADGLNRRSYFHVVSLLVRGSRKGTGSWAVSRTRQLNGDYFERQVMRPLVRS